LRLHAQSGLQTVLQGLHCWLQLHSDQQCPQVYSNAVHHGMLQLNEQGYTWQSHDGTSTLNALPCCASLAYHLLFRVCNSFFCSALIIIMLPIKP
jgi:hypothetical protein